jgi:NADP-reducing hydrogenase subunit HndB
MGISLEELAKIRESARNLTDLREERQRVRIVVGMGSCGIAAGARETIRAIIDELEKRQLHDVSVTQIGCIGNCEQEPLVDVYIPGKGKFTYGQVSPERARRIVASHIVNDNAIGDWIIGAN